MEIVNLSKLDVHMKWEKAMDSILNEKGTVYRSYQQGWLKALNNYEKIIKLKNKQNFRMQNS